MSIIDLEIVKFFLTKYLLYFKKLKIKPFLPSSRLLGKHYSNNIRNFGLKDDGSPFNVTRARGWFEVSGSSSSLDFVSTQNYF